MNAQNLTHLLKLGRITLNQLEAFVSLEKHKTFSAAATSCSHSGSSFTRIIQELESTLNERLFHRDASGVRLTDAGQTLLPFAHKMLTCYAAAVASVVNDNAATDTLTIRLAGSRTLMPLVMPALTTKLFDNIPKPCLRFEACSSQELPELVASGAADWGVGVKCAVRDDLRFIDVLHAPLGILAAPGVSPKVVTRMADIAAIPMVRLPDRFFVAQLLRSTFGHLDWYHGAHLVAGSMIAAFVMIREGKLATIVDAAAASHPMASDLSFMPIPHLLPGVRIGLLDRCNEIFDAQHEYAGTLLKSSLLASKWRDSVGQVETHKAWPEEP